MNRVNLSGADFVQNMGPVMRLLLANVSIQSCEILDLPLHQVVEFASTVS